MRRISYIASIALLVVTSIFSSSCVSQKKLVYFQGADTLYQHAQEIAQQYDMKLKPADQILIKITTSSSDPALLEIFARDVTMGSYGPNASATNQGGSLSNSYGYTVTNEGYVNLPAIGKVYVDHMTCEEVAKVIEGRIKELKLINDPEVTVRLMNARVTIIGAVKSPQTVNLTSERNTIIDVLAQCGDLSPASLRENIKLFREENGKRFMYAVDLTDVDVFKSPAFYVQQNDMIYVEPNKSLGIQSSAFYTFLGAGASILGLASSIVALILSIKGS